jgi:tetratricopeptide (TPR) repeat protein
MFRYIVVSAFLTLYTADSVAQALHDRPAGHPQHKSNPLVETNPPARKVEAADACISIVRLREPPKARHLYEKAMNAWMNHKPAEAKRRLEHALNVYPTFPEALTFYGGIQASLQQWASAEQSLQTAIQTDPSYSPAYIALAGVYNAQARFDDAQEATQQALAAGADSWNVQYEIARALIGKKQYETALTVTDAALRSNQHRSLLHLAKAHALLGLRRYLQAATELRIYVHDEPEGKGSEQARDLLNQIPGAE